MQHEYAILRIEEARYIYHGHIYLSGQLSNVDVTEWMNLAREFAEQTTGYTRGMTGASHTVSAYPASGYAVIFAFGRPVAKVIPQIPLNREG